MNYHKTTEDLSVYKIHCTNTENYDTINSYRIGENLTKGGGSAFGGEWKPSKPEDERFLGEPGEVKVTYDKNGYKIETIMDDDGRAIKERHHTHHNKPWVHTNPHDHIINWQKPKPGKPNFVKPHINYPNGAPEFKWYIGDDNMANKNYYDYLNTAEENRFKTISEFEDCMIRGGEVEFTRNGKSYSITHYYDQIHIGEAYKEETEMFADTVDEVLEYIIDGVRLRDIITEIEVVHRSF